MDFNRSRVILSQVVNLWQSLYVHHIYPTPPLGLDMTQGQFNHCTFIIFTQPLRSGWIWHKVNSIIVRSSYLPNPSARAGYDSRSIQSLYVHHIYPTPPLGLDMTQAQFNHCTFIIFTQPLRSGWIWLKLNSIIVRSSYLPNPSARAGYDTSSIQSLYVHHIYPTPPLGLDMTQAQFNHCTFIIFTQPLRSGWIWLKVNSIIVRSSYLPNPTARAGYDSRSIQSLYVHHIYPTPPLGLDMTQGQFNHCTFIIFTQPLRSGWIWHKLNSIIVRSSYLPNPTARAGYDSRSIQSLYVHHIYPTPPLGLDMTQAKFNHCTFIIFTQPLRSGWIWHKLNSIIVRSSYLPNPSARAGYDTSSIQSLYVHHIYPTPPLGLDMTQAQFNHCTFIIFTQPLRSGWIWLKVNSIIVRSSYLPNPSARAGNDTSSIQSLYVHHIYPTPPLGLDMTQGQFNHCTFIIFTQPLRSGWIWLKVNSIIVRSSYLPNPSARAGYDSRSIQSLYVHHIYPTPPLGLDMTQAQFNHCTFIIFTQPHRSGWIWLKLNSIIVRSSYLPNPSARAGYDSRSIQSLYVHHIYPTPPLGLDMTQGQFNHCTFIIFTQPLRSGWIWHKLNSIIVRSSYLPNPSARAGYDTSSIQSLYVHHIYPTPPLGLDMTQAQFNHCTFIIFTQPLRSGWIWHKLNSIIVRSSYLPNPSARAGYDSRSIQSLYVHHIYPTPPLGLDMTQGQFNHCTFIIFTQPLRSGWIWHKLNSIIVRSSYLPNPTARAGYDSSSIQSLYVHHIYPTPPLGLDMTQGQFNHCTFIIFTQPLRSGWIWLKVNSIIVRSSYLPNPSARAGYDTNSIQSLYVHHIYPTPPLGLDMTQAQFNHCTFIIFTQPLRSGWIWHKLNSIIVRSSYLPNPSARAGYDTRSIQSLYVHHIYPTPPLGLDMTQAQFNHCTFILKKLCRLV